MLSMKLLVISLLLCVSAVCIGWSNARSYSHGHRPLSGDMNTHTKELHKMQKRQSLAIRDQVCGPLYTNSLCTSGAYQEYAKLYQRCSPVVPLASGIQNTCSVNSMGSLCFTLDDTTFKDNVTSTCSTTVCSPECRSLLVNARNDFGCCINAYNTSFPVPLEYSYSLWSACEVETFTIFNSQYFCPKATFELKPTSIDPTCTSQNLNERFVPILCRRKYVEDLRQMLSEADSEFRCETYNNGAFNSGTMQCNANRFGTYCSLLPTEQNLTEAQSSCSDTSTCDPSCIATLNNIINTVGCCFMDRYNDSSPPNFLSYEFWSRCNLNSPGFCEELLNDAATIVKASSVAVASAITLAVILLQMVV